MNATTQKKKLIAVILVSALLALVLFLIFKPKPSIEQHYAIPTGIQYQKSFGHLYESNFLNYNGLGFFKTNLDTGSVEALMAGVKLPLPDNIYWVDDRGALVTFAESFNFSTIDTILENRDEKIDMVTKNYTWYVDFISQEINFVSEFPFRKNLAAVVDDKFIYFVPDFFGSNSAEAEGISTSALYAYSIADKRTELISDDLGLIDMSYLQSCSNTGAQVCMVAREATNPEHEGLYSLNPQKKAALMHNSEGRIFPTNQNNRFIVAKNSDTPQEGRDFVDYSPSSAILYDATDQSATPLGFDVGADDILTHFYNTYFYVFNNRTNQEVGSYVSGSLVNGRSSVVSNTLLSVTSEPFGYNFITKLTSGNTGSKSLVTNNTGELIFIDNKSQSILPPTATTDVGSIIEGCSTESEDYQFIASHDQYRIFFTESNDLTKRFKDMTTCLLENKVDIHNLNYHYGVRSSTNGRLISD